MQITARQLVKWLIMFVLFATCILFFAGVLKWHNGYIILAGALSWAGFLLAYALDLVDDVLGYVWSADIILGTIEGDHGANGPLAKEVLILLAELGKPGRADFHLVFSAAAANAFEAVLYRVAEVYHSGWGDYFG